MRRGSRSVRINDSSKSRKEFTMDEFLLQRLMGFIRREVEFCMT